VLLTGVTFCVVLFAWFVCCVSSLLLLGCQYQRKWLTGKSRLWNDLQCVDGDVKPCSLTHSLTHSRMVMWRCSCRVRSWRRAASLRTSSSTRRCTRRRGWSCSGRAASAGSSGRSRRRAWATTCCTEPSVRWSSAAPPPTRRRPASPWRRAAATTVYDVT